MKPEKIQIDEMINEGLGAGRIKNLKHKKQLENPLTKKSKEPAVNSMISNFDELKKLGKEMDQMQTNKQVKKQGLTPDPLQD